jgi:hypothetical protein
VLNDLFNHPIPGAWAHGGYVTMTLELRFENSCSSHHDFVIDARLGEGSQFMDRLVADFRPNGSWSDPLSKPDLGHLAVVPIIVCRVPTRSWHRRPSRCARNIAFGSKTDAAPSLQMLPHRSPLPIIRALDLDLVFHPMPRSYLFRPIRKQTNLSPI